MLHVGSGVTAKLNEQVSADAKPIESVTIAVYVSESLSWASGKFRQQMSPEQLVTSAPVLSRHVMSKGGESPVAVAQQPALLPTQTV